MKKIYPMLVVVLLCTNLLTLYLYHCEKEKVKNAFMPTFQEDYLTRQLTLTENAKNGIPFEGSLMELSTDTRFNDNTIKFDVPLVTQNPDYPNGCEAASATMLLNYHSIDITLKQFIDTYLITAPVYEKDGKRFGPDPSKAFAGNPSDVMYGWGTLEPTIKWSLSKVASDKTPLAQYDVITNDQKLDLSTLSSLMKTPLIIWATTDYTPVKEVYQWYSYDGKRTYTYAKNSHTVILTGYDEKYYYINDPLKDKKDIAIEKDKLEDCFDSAGRQAVTITFYRTLDNEEGN